jgi:hypothetical protein
MELIFIILLIFLGLFISFLIFTRPGRELLLNIISFIFTTIWGLIKGIIIVAIGLCLAFYIMRFFF